MIQKRSNAWFKFQQKLAFVDIYENGKKLDKIAVFTRHFQEFGYNTELTLIECQMHPLYSYEKSDRKAEVDEMMLEQDALREILKKRVIKGIKKLSAKNDDKGNLIVPFDRLLVWGMNFGQSVYNNHEQITQEI